MGTMDAPNQKTFEDIPLKPGKEVNIKCYECAKTPAAEARRKDCYMPTSEGDSCRRKRWYYKNLGKNRKRQRDGHKYLKYSESKCFCCKSEEELQVHHIIPKMFGGKDVRNNLATLCKRCHSVITKLYGACFVRPKNKERMI